MAMNMVATCLQTMLPMQADVHKLSGGQYNDKYSSADVLKAICTMLSTSTDESRGGMLEQSLTGLT